MKKYALLLNVIFVFIIVNNCLANNHSESISKSLSDNQGSIIDENIVDKNEKMYFDEASVDDEMRRFLTNNMIYGSIIKGPGGSKYIIFENILYKKTSFIGNRWTKISNNIKTVSVDPYNFDILYSIFQNNRICKSLDGGENWRYIENGIPANVVLNSIIINPHNSEEVFVLTSNGLYKTNDAGFLWVPVIGDKLTLSLQMDFFTPSKYYLLINRNTIYNDLWMTSDAGKNWKYIGTNLPKILVQGTGRTANHTTISVNNFIFYSDEKEPFLLAFTPQGIYKTVNDGETWTEFNNGFDKSNFITSAYLSDGKIFLACAKNISDNIYEPFIYKLAVNEKNWEKINCKLESGIIHGIVKDIHQSGIYVHSSNKLAYIDDELNVIGLNYGVTPQSSIKAFNVSQNDGSTILYAFALNSDEIDVERWGLWQSVNGGKSWSNCNLGSCKGYGGGLNRIDISPFNPLEIWAFNSNIYCNYSSVSVDGGKLWYNIFGNESIFDFSFNFQNKNVYYYTKRIQGYESYGLFRYDGATGNSTLLSENAKSFIISRDNNKNIITGKLEISRDGGWTWNQIDKDRFKQLCVKYNIDNLTPRYYKGNQILLSNWIYLISSNDNGQTWQILNTFMGDIKSVYVNPKNPNQMIVITKFWNKESWRDEYSVVQTMDGVNWKEILSFKPPKDSKNHDYNDYFTGINMSHFPDKDIIYVYGESGLHYSDNNGESWSKIGSINEDN